MYHPSRRAFTQRKSDLPCLDGIDHGFSMLLFLRVVSPLVIILLVIFLLVLSAAGARCWCSLLVLSAAAAAAAASALG